MSNVKSQLKWVIKHFSSLVLILFVAAAGVAYFTTKLSSANFSAIAIVVVAIMLVLVYYGLINIRAGLVFVLLALVMVVGVKYSKHPTVDANRFQSVTLANGTTYFGHLKDIESATPKLTDVYYLRAAPQPTTNTKDATPTSQQPILIKLSSDIHAPDDSMTIKANQIIYWSNLQDGGKVAQAIKKDLQKK